VAEIDQRGGEAIAFGSGRLGFGPGRFERGVERCCRTLFATKRAQPNLPVM
jgi:hypothetical protein